MPNKLKAIRVINSVAVAIGWIGNTAGSVMLAFMTALITVDVLGRYLFGAPTYIATEVSGYLMAAMVFMGLAQDQPVRPADRSDHLLGPFASQCSEIGSDFPP